MRDTRCDPIKLTSCRNMIEHAPRTHRRGERKFINGADAREDSRHIY